MAGDKLLGKSGTGANGRGLVMIRLDRVTDAVAAGQTLEVSMPLKYSDLLFLGADLRPTVEPGLFDVGLAPSAQSGEPAQFTLV